MWEVRWARGWGGGGEVAVWRRERGYRQGRVSGGGGSGNEGGGLGGGGEVKSDLPAPVASCFVGYFGTGRECQRGLRYRLFQCVVFLKPDDTGWAWRRKDEQATGRIGS